MSDEHANSGPRGRYLAVLALGALGVVYGDVGTSPLYAVRECFHGSHRVATTPGNILGILSLIFWSLTLIISIKYLVLVMRADNRGEGGILALMALLGPRRGESRPGIEAQDAQLRLFARTQRIPHERLQRLR